MHFETWLMIREQSKNNGHVGLCGNMHVFHIFLKNLFHIRVQTSSRITRIPENKMVELYQFPFF